MGIELRQNYFTHNNNNICDQIQLLSYRVKFIKNTYHLKFLNLLHNDGVWFLVCVVFEIEFYNALQLISLCVLTISQPQHNNYHNISISIINIYAINYSSSLLFVSYRIVTGIFYMDQRLENPKQIFVLLNIVGHLKFSKTINLKTLERIVVLKFKKR